MEFQGGVGLVKIIVLKEKYEANLEFMQEKGGCKLKCLALGVRGREEMAIF